LKVRFVRYPSTLSDVCLPLDQIHFRGLRIKFWKNLHNSPKWLDFTIYTSKKKESGGCVSSTTAPTVIVSFLSEKISRFKVKLSSHSVAAVSDADANSRGTSGANWSQSLMPGLTPLFLTPPPRPKRRFRHHSVQLHHFLISHLVSRASIH